MRAHLVCTGRVELGEIEEETRRRLEVVEATWLEFSPDPASLVVRHVQPTEKPGLAKIAGELLEFLSEIPENARARIPGGALYYLDEQSGQYVRFRVSEGGFIAVTWAQPDYSRGRREPYQGQHVQLVFEPYQRLNGTVKLLGRPNAADQIRGVIEGCGGLYPQGDLEIRSSEGQIEIALRDVNASVVSLLEVLRVQAEPLSSLEGEIDVSSFRAGDLDDYCRFVLKAGEFWLVRPSLWSDQPPRDANLPHPMEPAA
jgi:hypothetical protein